MGNVENLPTRLDRAGTGDDADASGAGPELQRLDILYGARMGTTFSTPSAVSSACLAPSRFSPRAATTVLSVPTMM
jgi:hypothetical protein